MAIAYVHTSTSDGLDATPVTIEVDVKQGLPGIHLVGMGNKAVSEARDRIRSAIRHSSLELPARKYTINLAPAEVPKSGARFDMPLAVALLVATGQLKQREVEGCVFIGELSLDGHTRPVSGLLGVLMAAKQQNHHTVFYPTANSPQAQLSDGKLTLIPVSHLRELYQHLKRVALLSPVTPSQHRPVASAPQLSLDDISGQIQAKRALQIALAGGHNLLLFGPPGTGKTLLAKAGASLLPPLEPDQLLSVNQIHELIRPPGAPLLTNPSFRAPHHTISLGAFLGGGIHLKPGELSLAHHGVLFLDELPEFKREHLEALRQPLEHKNVTISRLGKPVTFPAQFVFIAAMNPCPCGYFGTEKCHCSEREQQRYRQKISGPLFDRFDIVVHVASEFLEEKSSAKLLREYQHNTVVSSISEAKHKQYERYDGSAYNNGNCAIKLLTSPALSDHDARQLLARARQKLGFSLRVEHKILRVARTVADLDNAPIVTTRHVAEALQLRGSLDDS